jgi:hypothetical protein
LSLGPASWTSWADGVAALAQAAAIVVGGLWAYFKFIRGRTFAKRAELTVVPTVLDLPGEQSLKVTATLRNEGLAKLPLRVQVVLIYAIFAEPTDENPLGTREEQIGEPCEVFSAHDRVEAQETITDEIVVPLTDYDRSCGQQATAFRVECRVYAKQRVRKGGLRWTASAVIARRETVQAGEPAGVSNCKEAGE